MLFNRAQIIALDLAERQVLGTGQMALGKLFLTANIHYGGVFTVDQQGCGVVVHRLHRRKTSTHRGVNQGACQAEPGCGQQRVAGRKIQILLHLLLSRDQDKCPSIHGDPAKISHLGGKAGAGSHQTGTRESGGIKSGIRPARGRIRRVVRQAGDKEETARQQRAAPAGRDLAIR